LRRHVVVYQYTLIYHLVPLQNAVWGGFVALFLVYFAGIGFTGFFLKKKMEEEPGKWTWKTIIYEISLRNIMELRAQLSSTIGFLPNIWAYMMKQFIPHVILILFINLAQSNNEDGESLFGNYEGYANWPFQILGCVFCFLCSTHARLAAVLCSLSLLFVMKSSHSVFHGISVDMELSSFLFPSS